MRVEVIFDSGAPRLEVTAQNSDENNLLASAFRHRDLQAFATFAGGYHMDSHARLTVTMAPPKPLPDNPL